VDEIGEGFEDGRHELGKKASANGCATRCVDIFLTKAPFGSPPRAGWEIAGNPG
jgi:hypothetical protein